MLALSANAFSPASSGKWQATKWPGATCAHLRLLLGAHVLRPCGQRVRNRQPLGGATGDGISPPSVVAVASGRTLGSGTGIDASSAAVYGCAGCA